MGKNYVVIAGHNEIVPGASGNGYKEHVVARQIVKEVIAYFKELKETVYDGTDNVGTTKTMVWSNAAQNANKYAGKDDMVIAVHLNSSTNKEATGTEVFDYKGTQKVLAKKISARLAKDYGWMDRGWKPDGEKNIGLITATKAPILYVEVCFISNKSDMDKLMKDIKKAAKGIVEEVTGKTIPVQQPHVTDVTSVVHRVVTGSFSSKANAEKRIADLKKKGFSSFIEVNQNKHRVVTGSFSAKANAEKRVAELKKSGFDSFTEPKQIK